MRDSSVAKKSRVGISKGTGLATEALSLLILSHETMRNRITKAKPLIVLHDTMQITDTKGEAFESMPDSQARVRDCAERRNALNFN
jgi:hypothetical protein